MTLAEIKVLRDKYYQALLDLDVTAMNHSIGDASYENDSHRTAIEEGFKKWDELYTAKLGAGQPRQRTNKKAI